MALIKAFVWSRSPNPDIYQNLNNGVDWGTNGNLPDLGSRIGLNISNSNANHFVICGSNGAGTDDLIYYSLDNGQTVVQSNITGNLQSMYVDSRPSIYINDSAVYISTIEGLYYSGNDGADFSVVIEYDDPLFDGGTSIPVGNRNYTELYVNGNYILVGISTTGSLLPAEIYISPDLGITWTQLDNTLIPAPATTGASNIDGVYCSNDGNTITVACSVLGNQKVLNSIDGWANQNTVLSNTNPSTIGTTKKVFSVVNNTTIYYIFPFNDDNVPVYKSTDSGTNWTLQSSGTILPPTGGSFSANSFYSDTEGFVLIYDLSISKPRVLKTIDSGQTFAPITADDEFSTVLAFIVAKSIECGCPPEYIYESITDNCTKIVSTPATNIGGDPNVLSFQSVSSYGNLGLTLFPSLQLTDVPLANFSSDFTNPSGASQSSGAATYFYKNANFVSSSLVTPLIDGSGTAVQSAVNTITGAVWKRARNKIWGGLATYTDTSGAVCPIGFANSRLTLSNISAPSWSPVSFNVSTQKWTADSGAIIYTGPDDPDFPWLTFTKCITITEEKEYLIGIAGDNIVALDIDFNNDGSYTSIFQLYTTDMSDTASFRKWFVIPLTLPAGAHTIKLKGADLGGDFAFGAEIYDIPLQDFINNFVVDVFTADSYTASNIPAATQTLNCSAAGTAGYAAMLAALEAVTIFSTEDYRGDTVYEGGVWTCPSGYELDICNGIPQCILTEVVDKIECSYRLEKCGDPTTIEYTDADTNPIIADYVGKVLSDDTGCWQVSEATTLEIPTEKDTSIPPIDTCLDCIRIYKVYNCKDLLTPVYCTDQDLAEYADIYSVTLIVNSEAVSGCYIIRNEPVLTCDPLLASNIEIVSAFVSCEDCLPKVFKLTNCANDQTVLYSNTQSLIDQVGKSITIDGYPNICWNVSIENSDVFNTIAVELAESYKDCECCLQYQCIK